MCTSFLYITSESKVRNKKSVAWERSGGSDYEVIYELRSRDSVTSNYQTPRRELKIRHTRIIFNNFFSGNVIKHCLEFLLIYIYFLSST